MKSASVWLPLYSSVWWIKALGSSCVEQVYPDSSATASDSESTRRMLRIESCATVPKPYFLNVDTCFFFSPQVSHLVTFTLSCASISMLMTAWECVCVCVNECAAERKGWRDDEEQWGRMAERKLVFLWSCLCVTDEWLDGGGSFSPPTRCADKWAFLKKTGKAEDLPIPARSKWCFSSHGPIRNCCVAVNLVCRLWMRNHVALLNPGARERLSFWCGIIPINLKNGIGRRLSDEEQFCIIRLES